VLQRCWKHDPKRALGHQLKAQEEEAQPMGKVNDRTTTYLYIDQRIGIDEFFF
jgi:hypothetical protein